MDNTNNIAVGKITYPQAKICRIDSRAKLPTKATDGSAGYDLYSLERYELRPREVITVRTGLVLKPPPGFFTTIRGRSSLGKKWGIGIPQGVGTIDSDYCGPQDELVVLLFRPELGWIGYTDPYVIEPGDRIAQLLFERRSDISLIETSTEELQEQSRGGFGSSGK